MRRRTQNNCKLFKSKLRQTKNCKINERMNAENNDNINQGQKNTNRTRNADYIFSHCVSYTQTHARTETLLPVMRQPLQYLVVVFVFIAAAAVAVIVTILFLTHSKYNRLNFFSSFNVFFIFSSSFLFFSFQFLCTTVLTNQYIFEEKKLYRLNNDNSVFSYVFCLWQQSSSFVVDFFPVPLVANYSPLCYSNACVQVDLTESFEWQHAKREHSSLFCVEVI